VTDVELVTLLKGSPNSRYSKVKRLLALGRLLHIRRGLYCLPHTTKPHPFELAQYIYGPSYISLESALSYYNLIPEAVYTITSVTSKRSKEFQTPLGVFSFHHLPSDQLFTEVELTKEYGSSFLIAKPWKAICDLVFCYKKDWYSIEPLVNNLRIEQADLPFLSSEDAERLNDYYQHSRIHRFLKGVLTDLSKKRIS
jgi:predicted transcriptional regulator of viral defense system